MYRKAQLKRCHLVVALNACEKSSGTLGSKSLAARIPDALDPAAPDAGPSGVCNMEDQDRRVSQVLIKDQEQRVSRLLARVGQDTITKARVGQDTRSKLGLA